MYPPQGINKITRLQNWKKRAKKEVQGKALEYHYSSLPIEALEELGLISIVPSSELWEEELYQEWVEQHHSERESDQLLEGFLEYIKEQHSSLFDLEALNKQERVLIDGFRALPSKARTIVS